MIGTAIGYDSVNNFYIVETEDGRKISFEPIGRYDISIDDKIKGNFEFLGSTKLLNFSKNEEIDVIVQIIN